MILSCLWPARPALVSAALCIALSACAGPPIPVERSDKHARDTLVAAQQAAFVLYDAMAPSFGEDGAEIPYAYSLGQMPGGTLDCGTRFSVRALVTRCEFFAAALRALTEAEAKSGASVTLVNGGGAELADMIGVLRKDAPKLFALGRAAEVRSLQAIDFEWLAAMDQVFEGVKARALPNAVGAALQFRSLVARVERMLVRPEPSYGAASPYEVMQDTGIPIGPDDIAELAQSVARAESALERFDSAAARWRTIAATLSDYDALLASTQDQLSGASDSKVGIGPIRRYAAALIDYLPRTGAFK